jgi:hypothetical protein
MGYMSDVQSTYLDESGDIFTGRTRVKGIYIVPDSGAGSVVIKNGGSSGNTVTTLDIVAGGSAAYIHLPEDGLLCKDGAYAVLTDIVSATFFWA